MPHILSNDDKLATSGYSSSTVGSMTSLYDESEPTPVPSNKQYEGTLINRRNSFSEDHPTLQRNTKLQETRRTNKGFFTPPQITSSTFKIAAADDMHLKTSPVQDRPLHTSVIDTGGCSPMQSQSSIGVVNVLQTSPILPLTSSSQHTVLHFGNSIPVKQFTAKEKVSHHSSLSECAFSPPDNSPVPSRKPIFTLTSANESSTHNLSNYCRKQSLPELSANNAYSPPVVKRFTKAHHRCKSLSEFMPTASVNDPDSQSLLYKAFGGTRPQSMTGHQVE